MKVCLRCQQEYADSALETCPDDGAPVREALTDYRADADRLVGRVLGGRYLVEALIGRGGMGIVVRARHVFLDRQVAVKLLHPELLEVDKQRERFLREARVASLIRHPRVVEVTDFGITPEKIHYLVMECLDGCALSTYLDRRRRLGVQAAARIGVQLCEALSAMHASGLIHRDVKPQNCWVLNPNDEDATLQTKLLDFGIVSSAEGRDSKKRLTMTGQPIGTPHYMAPEQIRDDTVDARSDLYALGCVLWELVTGERPFDAATPADVIARQLYQPPFGPSITQQDIPAWFDEAVLACLQKDPNDRPSTAETLRATLQEGLQNEAEIGPASKDRQSDSDWSDVGTMQAMDTSGALDDTEAQDAPSSVSAEKPPSRVAWTVVGGLLILGLATSVAILASDRTERGGDERASSLAPTAQTRTPPTSARADEPEGEPASVATTDVAATTPYPHTDSGIVHAGVDASTGDSPASAVPPASMHKVSLDSQPSRAIVTRDKQRLGKTPIEISWEAGTAAPVITVRKNGYLAATVPLEGKDISNPIVITLRKRPQKVDAGRRDPPKQQRPPTFQLVPDHR